MSPFPSAALSLPQEESSEWPNELGRVLALPQRTPVDCARKPSSGKRLEYAPETQALVEVMTARFAIPRVPRADGKASCLCEGFGHPCILELNAEQAWALRELGRVGGLVGFLPVGSGKTILGILAPLAVPGVKTAVLLVKSDQRLHYRRAWQRLREHFRVPSLVMDDGGEPMIVNGAPTLHVIPYSKLSRPESTKLLEGLKPDMIVADEVHSIADRKSARTLRFLRYMGSRQGVKFAGWSGTLLDKSIRSMAHISAHALGTDSPVPINPNNVEAWCAVMDPSPQPDRTSGTAKAIYKAFGEKTYDNPVELIIGNPVSAVREGFRARLAKTPGVITSKTISATASITMRERKVEVPDNVKHALTSVRTWLRPDGEELVEAVEQARCVREVASGFYYHWVFGDEPRDLIEEWFAKRKAFNRELREKIQEGREFLDSRLLCEKAAERAMQKPPYEGELPTWWSPCWPSWRDVRDKVKHDQRARWIDDFLARDAAEWAKEHRGIVWCLSSAFGQRVAQLSGLPYHGGGPGAEERILAEKGDRSIIVSMKAHSEGRDGLQLKFSNQLIAEMPAGGKAWGQMLGRLCRRGQQADEIETWVYLHYHEAKDALRRALTQSEYVEEMTPTESLLSAADITFDI
jgi:hypothetical protein